MSRTTIGAAALLLSLLSSPALAQTLDPAGAPPPQDPPPETVIPSESETSPSLAPTVSGFIDGTYNYNFNHPAGGVTPYHTYTAPHHSFLLNAAHVALTGSDGKVSYAVEIDAGTDAFVNTLDDDFDIQEAWVSYTSDIGLGFKAGKFVTFNGIEVIESGSNPTISRGFLYGLAEPFTHVGALATYKISDQMDVAAGVVNGWDVMVDNNSLKTLVGKFGLNLDTFILTLSAYSGPEQPLDDDDWRTTFDATAMVKLGTIDLWLQANLGTEENAAADGDATWTGLGVQPVFHLNEELSLGARAELFSDNDGARTGFDQTLFNVSVTPAYALTRNLILRAEGRLDVSSEDVYADTDGDASSSQVIALGEALVVF
ncbi:MAG TPA: outer membrane beta-barrel protein [Kofleriaceae bacterium]|nr:outer membrane beta-barrel protein [Kofleriaceae bacterium]